MSSDSSWPAFPSHGTMGEVAHQGMTLRDYFAARAIDAAAADELRHPTYDEATYKGTAERAYLYADAMLKARQS